MKRRMLTILTALVLGACVSARGAYRTESTVTPLAEAHQYQVDFKIMEVGKDGKVHVLSTPRLVTVAGQECQAKAVEKEKDEVHCSALIKETDTGVEAVTTVTVMEQGNATLSTVQSLTIKKH
jgi:hypothetical protein